MNLHANAHAYIPCGHSEWTLRTDTSKLCLAAETKLSGSVVTLLYVAKTKVSDILFQNSKLYLWIGWGFDKLEVQIPTLPPICPARGVVGLDIDRCITHNRITKLSQTLSTLQRM